MGLFPCASEGKALGKVKGETSTFLKCSPLSPFLPLLGNWERGDSVLSKLSWKDTAS